MDYSNPKIPEGINTSQEHPLKDFFWLVGGGLLLILALLAVLSLGAGYLAKQIPFAKELEWSQALGSFIEDSAGGAAKSAYLNQLAHKLVQAHPLPEGIKLQVHYQASDLVNAYATLGGHIVIFQGLLDVLPSENALAMVLAHEIAHIRERHPIMALGRGASLTLVMALLGSLTGNSGVELFAQTGVLTMLSFSRQQESEADLLALQMVQATYGHVADSMAFFQKMMQQEDGALTLQFMQTHPISKARIAALQELAYARGWSFEGEVQPLAYK